MTGTKKHTLLAVPLAGILSTTLGACAHERFRRDLRAAHREFHGQPHTRAEHRRFHEELEDLHRDYHDQAYSGRRYSERDPYYGGGWYGGVY
jgi:hypothetical protein